MVFATIFRKNLPFNGNFCAQEKKTNWSEQKTICEEIPRNVGYLWSFFFCCPLILNPWLFRRTLIFIVSLSLLWIEKRGNLWLKHNMFFLLRPYFLSASRNARILVVCIEGVFHLLSSVNHFFRDKRLQKKNIFFLNWESFLFDLLQR